MKSFFWGGGVLHEMLEKSPIWKRILSFFSKRAVPCAALIDIHNTMTQQWGPFFQASLWAVSCSGSTGNWFFNEASKLNSINQHHCQPTSLAPKNKQMKPNLPRYHLQKITKVLSLGWHPIQRLSSRHAFLPCWASYKSPPMWWVLSVATGNPNSVGPTKLVSSQKALKCSNHGEKRTR